MNPSQDLQKRGGKHRIGAVVVGLAVCLAGLLVPAAPATAGGGYPYDSAFDCSQRINKTYGTVFGAYSWCYDENNNGSLTDEEQYSPYGFGYRNCTDWVAFRINNLGVGFNNWTGGKRFGNAKNWDDNARAIGWTVSTAPRVRSIAVSEAGTFGHVAFVESVNGDGSVNVSEYNKSLNGTYGTRNNVRFDSYIYVPGLTQAPAPTPPPSTDISRYANTIVKWSGNSTTSWFVTPDLKRMWIPDGGTYNQLKARGFAGPYVLDAATLDRMPDLANQWVASGSSWTGNRALRRGMSVRSSDGRYLFAMQGDGNLVMYGPTGRAIWATSWVNSNWGAQQMVIFQSDGNLVTYSNSGPIWASNTAGRGANHFEVQSDGNLVVYRDGTPLWASNTAGRT